MLTKLKKNVTVNSILLEISSKLRADLKIAIKSPELSEREKNILEWGKYYFSEKFTRDFCAVHEYFCEIRDAEFTNTLAPRAHAKTTIKCFLIPIYQSLVEPDKFKHYLNIQNTSSKAIAVNIALKAEFEKNEKLISDYGDQFCADKWTEKQFVLKNGVIFSAVSSGESVRGINYRDTRPDYIIADDLYNDDDAASIDRIFRIERWFLGSIYPARSQTSRTSIHIQGTAMHRNDLMHRLMEKDYVVSKKFKAILDYDAKKTLWLPFDKLMHDRKIMGSFIFEREYQNECLDDETSIIKSGWIKFYDDNIPEPITRIIGACDPAVGTKETNDPTAKVLVFESKNKNYYVHEVRNSRISFHENIEEIKNWHALVKFNIFKIEEISAFQIFGQELIRKSRVPVKEIKSVKDKITRKRLISPLFENGKIFVNKRIAEKLMDNGKNLLDELIYQITNNNPEHDDIADAIILALEDHAETSRGSFLDRITTM